jgi:hypothetical protein
MFTPQLGRYIKGVEYASMTSLLQDFRRQFEHECGGPVRSEPPQGAGGTSRNTSRSDTD